MTLRAVAGVSGGSGPITEPLVLASYAIADLPDPTEYAGGLVLISDATPDPAIAFSNGTQWVYLAIATP